MLEARDPSSVGFWGKFLLALFPVLFFWVRLLTGKVFEKRCWGRGEAVDGVGCVDRLGRVGHVGHVDLFVCVGPLARVGQSF